MHLSSQVCCKKKGAEERPGSIFSQLASSQQCGRNKRVLLQQSERQELISENCSLTSTLYTYIHTFFFFFLSLRYKLYLEYRRGEREKTWIWFREAVATPIQLNKTLKSHWESSNRPFWENVLNTNNNREEKGKTHQRVWGVPWAPSQYTKEQSQTFFGFECQIQEAWIL